VYSPKPEGFRLSEKGEGIVSEKIQNDVHSFLLSKRREKLVGEGHYPVSDVEENSRREAKTKMGRWREEAREGDIIHRHRATGKPRVPDPSQERGSLTRGLSQVERRTHKKKRARGNRKAKRKGKSAAHEMGLAMGRVRERGVGEKKERCSGEWGEDISKIEE